MIRPTDLRFELPDGRPVPDRLFSDIDLSAVPNPETHQLAVHNTHPTDTLYNARVWCEAAEAPMSMSIDGVAFWPAGTEILSIGIGDLEPDTTRAVWVQRDVGGPPTAQSAWLRISGESLVDA